jgi:hypothetical protein
MPHPEAPGAMMHTTNAGCAEENKTTGGGNFFGLVFAGDQW